MSLSRLVVCVETIFNLNVQIAFVLLVGLVAEHTHNLLALLDREGVFEIEDRLLPVRVLGMWPRRESNGFMTGAKVNVEPGNERVHKVTTPHVEAEVLREAKVRWLNRVKVERQERGRIRHDRFHLNRVNKRFGKSRLLQRRVVKTVYIVPD